MSSEEDLAQSFDSFGLSSEQDQQSGSGHQQSEQENLETPSEHNLQPGVNLINILLRAAFTLLDPESVKNISLALRFRDLRA